MTKSGRTPVLKGLKEEGEFLNLTPKVRLIMNKSDQELTDW